MSRTEEEMREEIFAAREGVENGTMYRGMSYEEGVKATLEWVLGDTEERPMD